MVWERAKGELRSMTHTFYDAMDGNMDRFEGFEKLMLDFVNKIEDGGYEE